MKKREYYRDNTSESGVALIFALAMLALLLIMLIGFLASAIFEQRIAYNQSGQSITRTIARSALARASNVLAVYENNIADEIPAFSGYADDNSGLLAANTVRRLVPVSSVNTTNVSNMNNDQANTLIEKLLKQNGLNKDNYYWDKDNKPQWIPMIVNVPGQSEHITGRFAYTIIPNLGIEPNLLSQNAPTRRVGGRYEELSFGGFELTTDNWSRIFKKNKWVSLDLLGSRYVLGNGVDAENPWKNNLTATDKAREDFKESEATTFMEVVNTLFTTDQDRSVDYDDGRINLAQAGTQANADKIADLITSDNDLKKQIAANIVDYIDAGNVPTSDVVPANWLTSTPSYTGNEKTPYINQIVPALSLTAAYTRTYTETGGGGILGALTRQRTYTLKLSDIKLKGKIFVELINIYPDNLKAKKVILKGLKATFDADTAQARGGSQVATVIPGVGGKTQPITFGDLTCDIAEITVGGTDIMVNANNYAVMESEEVTFSGNITMNDLVLDPYSALLGEPRLDVTIRLKKLEFDRAILYDENDKPVDFVKGMSVSDKDFINRVLLSTADDRAQEMSFNGNNQTKTVSQYASFAVIDPRCNLGNSGEWLEGIVRNRAAELMAAADLKGAGLNFGTANEFDSDDDKMANDDRTKEKDLEVATDPAKVSTGYIRNGAMQSVWELGFIHRGKPWQTINLKAADDSKDKTYFNDAVLLDEIAFYDTAGGADSNKEKTKKFNINYPYTHIAAFGPLVKDLKYCKVDDNLLADDGELYAYDGTPLTDPQWMSLRKWIAWKCYESQGGKPSKYDGAKNYHFYRHRGYLANVITDWAVNCPDSPYHGKDLMDAYLEELISKIVPLTRAGEPYEYFTIYTVAQSIKDVGGIGSDKTISHYDRTGTLKEGNCQQGKWEEDFDEVTGQVFMVARVRRNLECVNADSCKDGKHVSDCQYGITVIESYTINEL